MQRGGWGESRDRLAPPVWIASYGQSVAGALRHLAADGRVTELQAEGERPRQQVNAPQNLLAEQG